MMHNKFILLGLCLLRRAGAVFHTIDTNEDLQIGVAFSGLDKDTIFTGGGRSGETINPEVGAGLLVTRDNGSHWLLEVPGGGAYKNPFPMAVAVASNRGGSGSSTVCAAGIASVWCSKDTSSPEATSFVRAPIVTPNGTSGEFADVKWEPGSDGGSGSSGIFQVTGQFGTEQNWTNGLAVSTDGAASWSLRSVSAATAPTFASATPSATVWYTTAASVPAYDDEETAAAAEAAGALGARAPRALRRVARFLGAKKWAELWGRVGANVSGASAADPPPPAPSANYVGQVTKTTDGGATWELLLSNDGGAEGGTNYTFGDVHCFDEETCIVAANGGCGSSPDNICDGSQPQNMGGAVWVTVDGGASWAETLRDKDDDYTFGFTNLRMVGAREAYAVGGGLERSRGGGVHAWHTTNVTDPAAWDMTLVTADLAQLSLGMDVDATTGELLINVIQKDMLCGVVRGFTDDHEAKM
jgi:hypothetical protein